MAGSQHGTNTGKLRRQRQGLRNRVQSRVELDRVVVLLFGALLANNSGRFGSAQIVGGRRPPRPVLARRCTCSRPSARVGGQSGRLLERTRWQEIDFHAGRNSGTPTHNDDRATIISY